jgi:transposase
VEGAGSYGAGLARHLRRVASSWSKSTGPTAKSGRAKVRPTHSMPSRRPGPPCPDVPSAWPRPATATSKPSDALMVARRSARESRTKAINQIRQLVDIAPDELPERSVGVPSWRIAEGVGILRVHADADPVRMATKSALGTLGRRAVALGEEGKRLDVLIARLVDKVAPELVELVGVGPDTAALLLIAAGDNPSRLRSEATSAKLCGLAPLEAFSGKVTRHRLNRGGDRQANSALWRIVLTRMSCHAPTKVYVARRTAEGKSKREIMHILKRYVAREIYHYLPRE